MGRQGFSHPNPGAMVSALRAIIHDGSSVEKAMQDSGL